MVVRLSVDHDLTRLGRRTPLDLAAHGDVAATLRAVLPLVKQKSDRSFLDDMLRQHAGALEHVVDAYTHDIEHHAPIHPEYAANVLDELAAEDVNDPATGLAVHAALTRLPATEREVLELAYFEDMTQTEIAARLRLPLGTVKTRTRSGLHRLAAYLEEMDE